MKKILTTIILLCTCLSVYAEEDNITVQEEVVTETSSVLDKFKKESLFHYEHMEDFYFGYLHIGVFDLQEYLEPYIPDITDIATPEFYKELEDIFLNRLNANIFTLLREDFLHQQDELIGYFLYYLNDDNNKDNIEMKYKIAQNMCSHNYRVACIKAVDLAIELKDFENADKLYLPTAMKELARDDFSPLLEKYPIRISKVKNPRYNIGSMWKDEKTLFSIDLNPTKDLQNQTVLFNLISNGRVIAKAEFPVEKIWGFKHNLMSPYYEVMIHGDKDKNFVKITFSKIEGITDYTHFIMIPYLKTDEKPFSYENIKDVTVAVIDRNYYVEIPKFTKSDPKETKASKDDKKQDTKKKSVKEQETKKQSTNKQAPKTEKKQ